MAAPVKDANLIRVSTQMPSHRIIRIQGYERNYVNYILK